jgi:hypothetical protein
MRLDESGLDERYAMLRGQFPVQRGDRDMVITLTDAQVARVLELTSKIARISLELPAPPPGYQVDVERAKFLRASLEKSNDLLVELGALLR